MQEGAGGHQIQRRGWLQPTRCHLGPRAAATRGAASAKLQPPARTCPLLLGAGCTLHRTGSRTGGCPWSCRTGEGILPWKGINGDKDEHRELWESIQGIPSSLKRWHLSAHGNSSSFSPHLLKVLVLVLPRRPMLSSAAIPQPSHRPITAVAKTHHGHVPVQSRGMPRPGDAGSPCGARAAAAPGERGGLRAEGEQESSQPLDSAG